MNNPFDCITNFIFIDEEPKQADIILVPGAPTLEHMVKAVELYKNGLAPLILPSGGYNKKINYVSEWEYFKEYALSQGVHQESIIREDMAVDTFDNARLSLKVINDKKIKVKKALLVCRAFHARRAELTYKTVFPKYIEFIVVAASSADSLNRNNWYTKQEWIDIVMGEVTKIGTYFKTEIFKTIQSTF